MEGSGLVPNLLTINGGSSSTRFAVLAAEPPPRLLLEGKMERVGSEDASLTIYHGAAGAGNIKPRIKGRDIDCLLDWLESQPLFQSIGGVGHRVVHGMQHADPERVTPALLQEL